MQKIMLLVFTVICTLGLPMPAMIDAADSLPAGFIAIASDMMNWSNAKAFCVSKGGRLPLIGGKNKIASSKDIPSGTPVDGFDSVGAKWPSGLHSGMYWTGTGRDIDSGPSWVVYDNKGVTVSNDYQSRAYRVVCVP